MRAARERSSSSSPLAPMLTRPRSLTVPSAPPLEAAISPRMNYGAANRPAALGVSPSTATEASGSSPPEYYSVLANDPKARENAQRTRQLMGSMANAGVRIGQFFGIHDEESQWNPAGTLPPNRQNVGYYRLPSRDVDHGESMAIVTPPQENSPPAVPQQQRELGQQRRRRWKLGGVSNTIKRLRNKDPTREEVMKSLPSFWPVMTILIAIIEVGLLVATIISGGLAPIRFTPEVNTSTVRGFGGISEIASKEIVPNFFIGTSKEELIHTGALYSPCMRENTEFQVQAAKNRFEENSLRCCNSEGECGMVTQEMCTGLYLGTVLGGASQCRSEMNTTMNCQNGVVLHPCCIGLLGECIVTTEDNCTFHGGVWHPDKVVCSEVGEDCFKGICKFSWIRRTIGQVPSQGLRFLSAIFLYDGVITLVIVGLFKLYKSWTIERRIGWLRVFCIYIISGIGGFLFTGLFDPTSVSVGGTGGLFGLLAVNLVELLQGWKWVHKPCLELFKILTLVLILLFLGTLPYIDNFTQIGGFMFGVLASFIFVPYISLGKWDRFKKLCLLSVALPVILVLFLLGFVIFYNLENPNFCPECSYINCIPYTETFCENFIINFAPFVPLSET